MPTTTTTAQPPRALPPLPALIEQLRAAVELEAWDAGPPVTEQRFQAAGPDGTPVEVTVSPRGKITAHPPGGAPRDKWYWAEGSDGRSRCCVGAHRSPGAATICRRRRMAEIRKHYEPGDWTLIPRQGPYHPNPSAWGR